MKEKLLTFIIILFCELSNNLYSQKFTVEHGQTYSISYITKITPYSKKSYDEIIIYRFAYYYKLKKNFSVGIGVSFYDPYVSFNIEDYPYSRVISVGKSSGTLYNLTLLVGYKYPLLRRLNFNSFFGINNSYYRDYYGLVIEGSIGLNKYDPLQGIGRETGYEGFQFRPEISVGIEWLFLKYFSLEANVAYIQGTRKIQDYEIRYTLMDSEEYYAKNYSNGTMWYPSIRLSFYFGGYIKDELNRKKKKKIISNKKRRKIYK